MFKKNYCYVTFTLSNREDTERLKRILDGHPHARETAIAEGSSIDIIVTFKYKDDNDLTEMIDELQKSVTTIKNVSRAPYKAFMLTRNRLALTASIVPALAGYGVTVIAIVASNYKVLSVDLLPSIFVPPVAPAFIAFILKMREKLWS